VSNTHMIYFEVVVTMEEMDGHPDGSAELALDQVTEALAGRVSQYGLPGEVTATVIDAIGGCDLEDA